jgi:hypothetical protein
MMTTACYDHPAILIQLKRQKIDDYKCQQAVDIFSTRIANYILYNSLLVFLLFNTNDIQKSINDLKYGLRTYFFVVKYMEVILIF